jgi:ABC-2 type transport system permease protein|tara:strand:- start:2180 stop:3019 length:840 start_codon:yes stop_codon:yes gene_type:complete
MILALIKNELIKISSKWRSFIGFIAIAVLMPLVMWGFSVGGSEIHDDMTRQLEGSFIIVGSVFNGFLATYLVMNFLWVHIPFLVTLVAGDVVAGEGAAGTFRIYLTRPVSRFKIILSKLLATYLYTLALVLFFAFMSLGLGSIWLGTGDLIVFDDGILILSAEMAWTRFALAFLFAAAALFVVASLCFMFSAMVNNGIGPVIGSMAIVIVGLAVATIPLDLFENVSPYLFTDYFDIWNLAFHDPLPWVEIGNSLLILGLYTVLFSGIGFTIFLRKDIRT